MRSLAIVPIVRVLFMTMSFVGQSDRRRREPIGSMARRMLLAAGFTILAVANFFTASLQAEQSEAASPEALLKPWADATARFQKSRETASDALVRLLDSAEEKARASGDLEKVKAVKQERTQFLQDQTLPKSVKTASYEKASDAAKSSLRAAAQKTNAALVRQKFDEEAATIEQELGELVGAGKLDLVKGKIGASGPPDGRIYWVEKKEKGNEFCWIKPLEWIETTHDGTRKRYQLKEIARTADFIELYDKTRDVGVRLLRKSAKQAMNYRESAVNVFGSWTEGAWVVEPADVVYLSDLPEKVIKAQSFDKNGIYPNTEGKDQIYLANRPTPKGVFTHPASKDAAVVSYEIGALHKSVFRAKIGVADLLQYNPATPLKFVVLGDGKKLYTSEPVTKWGVPQECEVQVRGVNELVLRVECDGDFAFALAVWCEPRLSSK